MSADTTWTDRVEDYLTYRRSFGFDLVIDGGRLGSFARFADKRGVQHLTLELAVDWARASRHPRPISWARRIEVLRGFAAFCLRTDPETIIPPRKLFGPAHRRLVPHIYTDEELLCLLEGADHLGPLGTTPGHLPNPLWVASVNWTSHFRSGQADRTRCGPGDGRA